MPETPHDGSVVVGEEAHIVARNPEGPRGDSLFPRLRLDDYENLILLCPNCHRLVDTKVNEWSIERLKQVKEAHEQSTEDHLDKASLSIGDWHDIIHRVLMRPLWSGADVWNIICDTDSYNFEVADEAAVSSDVLDLIDSFLQSVSRLTT